MIFMMYVIFLQPIGFLSELLKGVSQSSIEIKKMKNQHTLLAVFVAAGALVLLSNSSGVAHQQNKDRTGAPGSDNTCQQCHAGGSFAPEVSAFLVVEGDIALSGEYVPGATHTLVVSVSASGSPQGYGVHGTAVLSDGSNAGTFNDQDPNDCVWLDEVDGRHIFEQNDLCPNGTFEIEWVAPAEGSGPVSVYAATIAANGNGTSAGDAFAGGQFDFEEMVTSVDDLAMELFEVRPGLNGALAVNAQEGLVISVLTLDGRILFDGALEAGSHTVNLSHAGLAIVHAVSASGAVQSQKVWF